MKEKFVVETVEKNENGYSVKAGDGQFEISNSMLNGLEPKIGDAIEAVFLKEALIVNLEVSEDGVSLGSGKAVLFLSLNGNVILNKTKEEVVAELEKQSDASCKECIQKRIDEIDGSKFPQVLKFRLGLLDSIGVDKRVVLAEKTFFSEVTAFCKAFYAKDVEALTKVATESDDAQTLMCFTRCMQEEFKDIYNPTDEELFNSDLMRMLPDDLVSDEILSNYLKERARMS
ncbi:MAG: hypothetical protein R3Y43_02460 [Alphaproteobacteria bacterium]